MGFNLFGSLGNPFGGDIVKGINVGNAVKQVTTGKDYDIIDGLTNSNRAGQTQMNALPDWGVNSDGGGASYNNTQLPAVNGGGGVLGDSLGGGSAPAGGGGAIQPALNMGAVNNTQLAIDQIPGLLAAALEAERTNKANTLRSFDAQEGQQRGTYNKSTTTNQQNYDSNYMDSIRAGIKGLGSLVNILRGSGAAGGTAEDLARDTVGGITSSDIRTGADTQQENQASLDSSLSNFLTELKGKRQSAEDTFTNNERAINRDSNTQLQDLYGKMAGFYGDAGRTTEAQNFMARAGGLTPQIAQNSMTQRSAYDTAPVAVQAPQVTAFAAPTQPDAIAAPKDGQVGSGIFTMARKKDQQQTAPTAMPVGA